MDATTPIPTSREQLCALLAEAAEIEHHLMCSYLYAAFSLKTGADEALTERELVATRRWRQEILAVAIEEMGHLTMVCNILSSLGAPAHLVHQNFPILPGFHPSGVVIRLAPFSPEVIAHFVYLERPEGAQVADGLGYEPVQGYVRQLSMDRLMTVCTDYDTVGQLYRSITAGLESLSAALGEQRLFVGNPAHQLDSGVAQLPGLRTVQCLSTALACIDAIVLQGEGADACSEDSHYRRFLSIQEEYRQLLEQRPAFRPARECAENPVMRPPPTPQGRVWVQREPAACLLDLANALYNHCLRCLALAYAGVDRGTQRMLVAAGVDLMHLLTPVAQVLSTLPAGDQGRTPAAGMSFATIRSAAALMAGVASIGILIERLMEIADRCGQLAGRHPALAALLVSTGEGAARIAGRLPAHTDAAALVVADAVIRRPPPALVPALGPVQVPAAPPVPTSTPDAGVQVIHGKGLDILYAGVRCIHARHCVLELPSVFKANVPGEWIDPSGASSAALVAVAHKCPSGAIRYRRHDGGQEEQAPPVNLVRVRENGPLAVSAPVVLNGAPVGFRVVLCRCGASRQKPYCDGSHVQREFSATGEPATTDSTPLADRSGALNIDPEINGPLVLNGNVEICTGTGRTINRLTSVRLCRCGGSANKPYCDGSHRRNGFEG